MVLSQFAPWYNENFELAKPKDLLIHALTAHVIFSLTGSDRIGASRKGLYLKKNRLGLLVLS